MYEIIVSRKNFALASYGVGQNFCKLFRNGIYALAYETPHQSGVSLFLFYLKMPWIISSTMRRIRK